MASSYTSTISDTSSLNGTMTLNDDGTVSYSLQSNASCTVSNSQHPGSSVSFDLSTGGNTFHFNGATPPNSTTYVGQCRQTNRPPRDDNWLAVQIVLPIPDVVVAEGGDQKKY